MKDESKIRVSDLPIIFVENPISRSFINVLIEKNILDTEIIYLNKTFSLGFLEKLYFKSRNYYPRYFLNDNDLNYLIDQIEDFFELSRGFIGSIYKFDNIYKFNNIYKINSNSINSKESMKFFNNHSSSLYLNANHEILREIFDTNKSFFHIHPGYLPKVKGADGSLHSIDKFGEIGCSFFEMTKKIDEGKILKRINRNFNKLKLSKLAKYKVKDLYRIWFSFFDPALRAYMYKNLIETNLDMNDKLLFKKYNHEESNYYSFVNENDLNNIFYKIFK